VAINQSAEPIPAFCRTKCVSCQSSFPSFYPAPNPIVLPKVLIFLDKSHWVAFCGFAKSSCGFAKSSCGFLQKVAVVRFLGGF
jgi:hypothetical protein